MSLQLIPRWFLLSVLIALFSCNSSRIIKPLDKGETQIGANLGGPLISMGGSFNRFMTKFIRQEIKHN